MSGQCQTDLYEDICLSERDLPMLMENLVEVSSEWEEIGIALGLPSHTRIDCRSNKNKISLTNILIEWIKCQPREEITLKKLKFVLESPLIGRRRVAQNMMENFTAAKTPFAANKPSAARKTLAANKPLAANKALAAKRTLAANNPLVANRTLAANKPFAAKKTLAAIKPLAAKKTLAANKPLAAKKTFTAKTSNASKRTLSGKRALATKRPLAAKNQQLIDLYSVCKKIPADSWPPVGAASFINLALINKNKQGTGDYNYTVRGCIDDIIATKEKIEYDEVFGQYQSGALILVEGRPGCGKTTLVHKVSRDWATTENVLCNANIVLLIPLRSLAKGSDESLTGILTLFYFDKEDREKVFTDIKRSNGEGVCFIIDGLDEYKPQNESNSVINRLLQKTYLPKAMVIVASRPIATATLRDEAPVTKQIEVLGFTQQQIFEYIRNFPFTFDVSCLREYLYSHLNILHMCYLPVHAAMICYLYHHDQGHMPQTETEIYEHFTKSIVLRKQRRTNKDDQLHSLEDIGGENQEYFRKLCHLAFDMTIHSKQVIHKCDTEVLLSHVTGPYDAPSLGMITIDKTALQYGLDDTYTFLHLTFQEYLAALYLTTLEEEQQMEIIGLHQTDQHMCNVWKFYCGMVEFEGKVAQIQLIMSSADLLYRVQCAYESQQSVVCDHAIEVQTGALSFSECTLTPADLNAVGYAISTSSHTVTKLDMSGCDLHANHIQVFLRQVSKNKLKCIQTLILKDNCIGGEGAAYLAEALKSCNNLQTLDLYGNNIGAHGVVSLAEALKSCIKLQTLILVANNIGAHGAASLAEALKSCNNLQALDLRANRIGAEGAAALAVALKACNNLQTLDLRANNIGNDGATALAETLKSFNNLQELELRTNKIGAEGAKALAEAIKSCHNLQTLGLYDNNIGTDGAEFLAEALKSCNNLRTLGLRGNNIGDEGAAFLAEALKSYNNNLHALNLRDNNISTDGAAILAEALKSCSDLRTLNLGANNIGADGAAYLAEALKCCHNLQALYLKNNNIGDDGATSLAEALKSCKNLQILYLRNNDIGDDGVASLSEGLKTCNNLESLDLRDNNIGAHGAASLAKALQLCNNLQALYLRGNNVGDDGAASLAKALKSCNNLQTLYLKDSNIGDDGIVSLAEGLKSCYNLRTLDLTANNYGSHGEASLVELKSCIHICLN